ncbi:MAG TPA: AAA family ATPase [Planctomycetota bacterium]|nr:AAA family ATPase [Planctomycetota bacterium]
MLPGEETVKALREALRVSPDNLPLRRHLAETLSSLGRFDEAVTELKGVLHQAPRDEEVLLALATAYHRGGKGDEALVIVEDLIKRSAHPSRAHLLHARILLDAGNAERAVRQYRSAIDLDPDAADAELAMRLGLSPDGADAAGEASGGRVRRSGPGGGGEDDDEGLVTDVDIERPKISFEDVGGMEDLKEEVRMKILHPLQNPELFKAYGKKIGGGILMYGPPGCGKTYLARATAGEVSAAFLSIGLHDVLDMWIGNSERNLHAIFDRARRARPCVLFFDEVDALGASRADFRTSAGRQVINQFLSELDGSQGNNEGVLVLGATNAPWAMDSAFRRPGRFDRILFVPPPDREARAAILRIHLKGKPSGDVDCGAVAAKTEGHSGADLRALVDAVVEEKLRAAMKSGRPAPIGTKDLLGALKQVRPSTKEWFATAKNYAIHANESGQYDDILRYLEKKR